MDASRYERCMFRENQICVIRYNVDNIQDSRCRPIKENCDRLVEISDEFSVKMVDEDLLNVENIAKEFFEEMWSSYDDKK